MKFARKHGIAHLVFGMLLHYVGKLKIQIFCRYSVDMEENANKSHLPAPMISSLSRYLTDSHVGLRLVLLTQD